MLRLTFTLMALIAVGSLVFYGGQQQADANQARIASVLGVGQVQGRDVLVHIALLVREESNLPKEAEAALRERGARPISRSDYVLLGPTWRDNNQSGSPKVSQWYNSSGAPGGNFLAELQAAQNVWTAVTGSDFEFAYAGTTTRCGSLIQECPGSQVFDQYQDVGWNDLGRCSIFRCTLAVTWFGDADGDGFMDDADVAFNTRISPWATGCIADTSFRTVGIHELGHVLGLGHSEATGAIMAAYYDGAKCSLHGDDEAGLIALYPTSNGDPTPTNTPQNTPTPTSTPEATPTPSNTATPTPTSPPSAGVTVTAIDTDPGPSQSNTVANCSCSYLGVTVAGSGFVPGANVTLEGGQGPAPIATNVSVQDSNTLTMTLTLKSGGPPRESLWDVRVTNADSSSGVLLDGLRVTP